MTQQFRLNCEQCKAPQAVEPRHAGSSIHCDSCQATIDVPKLREMKQLELISDGSPSTPGRGWGRLSGGLFAAGLVSLVISAGSLYYLYDLRQLYEKYTVQPNVENFEFSVNIDNASLTDSWVLWEQLVERKEIINRETPGFVRMRNEVKRLDFWSNFFYGLTTVGLLSMLCSPFFRTKLEG